jgi:hypothetical protein
MGTSNIVWSYPWYRTLVAASKVLYPTYLRKWRGTKNWADVLYRRANKHLQRYQAGEKLGDLWLTKTGSQTMKLLRG